MGEVDEAVQRGIVHIGRIEYFKPGIWVCPAHEIDDGIREGSDQASQESALFWICGRQRYAEWKFELLLPRRVESREHIDVPVLAAVGNCDARSEEVRNGHGSARDDCAGSPDSS